MKMIDLMCQDEQRFPGITTASQKPVYELSNVSTYIWTVEREDWPMSSLPRAIPPHPTMWCEWVIPAMVCLANESGRGFRTVPNHLGYNRAGCSCYRISAREYGLKTAMRLTMFDDEDVYTIENMCRTALSIGGDIEWVIVLTGYAQNSVQGHPGFGRIEQTFRVRLLADSHGTIKDEMLIDPEQVQNLVDAGVKSPGSAVKWFFMPAVMGFSLANCKNVVTRENAPSKQLVKARASRGKPPIARFHTLHIVGVADSVKEAARGRGSNISLSSHIRRGHFRTYTAERPLFGKYAGTWWWESTVVGSKDVGEVSKDYTVTPPPSGDDN